jgi:hypothetical protein
VVQLLRRGHPGPIRDRPHRRARDVATTAATLAETFTEVHDLPGRDLMPIVDDGQADDTRVVYLMTRDNMLEGDTGASGLAPGSIGR